MTYAWLMNIAAVTDHISPELEAIFVAAALELGTQKREARDKREEWRMARRLGREHFGVLPMELERIVPYRLLKPMYDIQGREFDLFEKVALLYIWWVDRHG